MTLTFATLQKILTVKPANITENVRWENLAKQAPACGAELATEVIISQPMRILLEIEPGTLDTQQTERCYVALQTALYGRKEFAQALAGTDVAFVRQFVESFVGAAKNKAHANNLADEWAVAEKSALRRQLPADEATYSVGLPFPQGKSKRETAQAVAVIWAHYAAIYESSYQQGNYPTPNYAITEKYLRAILKFFINRVSGLDEFSEDAVKAIINEHSSQRLKGHTSGENDYTMLAKLFAAVYPKLSSAAQSATDLAIINSQNEVSVTALFALLSSRPEFADKIKPLLEINVQKYTPKPPLTGIETSCLIGDTAQYLSEEHMLTLMTKITNGGGPVSTVMPVILRNLSNTNAQQIRNLKIFCNAVGLAECVRLLSWFKSVFDFPELYLYARQASIRTCAQSATNDNYAAAVASFKAAMEEACGDKDTFLLSELIRETFRALPHYHNQQADSQLHLQNGGLSSLESMIAVAAISVLQAQGKMAVLINFINDQYMHIPLLVLRKIHDTTTDQALQSKILSVLNPKLDYTFSHPMQLVQKCTIIEGFLKHFPSIKPDLAILLSALYKQAVLIKASHEPQIFMQLAIKYDMALCSPADNSASAFSELLAKLIEHSATMTDYRPTMRIINAYYNKFSASCAALAPVAADLLTRAISNDPLFQTPAGQELYYVQQWSEAKAAKLVAEGGSVIASLSDNVAVIAMSSTCLTMPLRNALAIERKKISCSDLKAQHNFLRLIPGITVETIAAEPTKLLATYPKSEFFQKMMAVIVGQWDSVRVAASFVSSSLSSPSPTPAAASLAGEQSQVQQR